ncbi:MAG: tetratricopeptide repeat protein [Acidobacteriota bacterium]
MIDNSALQTRDAQELAANQELRVDPPLDNPFVEFAPVSLIKSSHHWNIDWIETGFPLSSSTNAHAITENILSASRRDLEKRPSSPRAHTNLGLALLNGGRLNEAADQFVLALIINPKQYVAVVNLARIKAKLGLFDEAIAFYEQARDQRPDDISPILGIAYVAMRRRDFNQAVELLDRALSSRDEALPRYQMAIALLGLGKTNQALHHLKAAARSQVRSPALHVTLGATYVTLGDFRRAARCFRAALALSPKMLNAIHGLALALLNRGDTNSVSQLLSEHVGYRPDDYKAREIFAHSLIEQHDYRKAQAQLFQALNLVRQQSPQARDILCRMTNNLGVCEIHLGNVGRAQSWYMESIKFADFHTAGDLIPLHNLAGLFLNIGNISHARKYLDLCEERFPDNPQTKLLSAIALMKESRHADAIETLQDLVHRDDAAFQAYSGLGCLLAEEEANPRKALGVLEEGWRKHPGNPVLANNLAYVYLLLNDPAHAEILLNSIPQKEKDNPYLRATTGLLCLTKGELQEGERLYRHAEKMAHEIGKPNLARVIRQKMHLELARAYQRMGDSSAAWNELKRGLAINKGRATYRRDLEALENTLNLNQGNK